MTVSNWIKKNASTILTCLGAGGVVATVVLAVKATLTSMDKIQAAQIDKGEEILNGDREGEIKKNDDGSFDMPGLTILETVQVCWKEYVPTAAVGIGSLVCIFGANILSRHQQASLASAYTALAGSFEVYRNKVEKLCGPGTNAMVDKIIEQEKRDMEDDRPPWDEMQTFYIEGQSQFFERTMEQVLEAEYHLNRNFILRGEATLNELYSFLELPNTEEGERIGWNQYDGEAFHGYQWIDFNHRYYTTEDGITVCAIDMPFPPHPCEEAYSTFKEIADEMASGQ